jgi:hypothetical protein
VNRNVNVNLALVEGNWIYYELCLLRVDGDVVTYATRLATYPPHAKLPRLYQNNMLDLLYFTKCLTIASCFNIRQTLKN